MKKTLTLLWMMMLSLTMWAQNDIEIKDLLNNERYESAEQILEEKISKDGPEPNLNYQLIKVYLGQEKMDDAKKLVELYHLNVADESADPLNRIAYAGYLLSSGRKQEAAVLFDEILDKKNKKNPVLLMAAAEVIIQSDTTNLHKALELLEIAGKRDKQNAEIDILSGNAYRMLGDASHAYQSYQSALKKDPDNVKAHYNLGSIFTSQKNPEVYMPHFMKAYAIDSTYAPVLDALYDHYYFRNVKDAKKFLEKYIANTDYSLKNDYRLTDLLYLTKEYDKAIRSAKAILQKEKEKAQPRLHKLIAYSFDGLADSLNAMKYLDEYFAKEDTARLIAPDFELRARLTEKIGGDTLQAIGYYKKAFELDSLLKNKIKYAEEISNLYKSIEDYKNQAKWLGYLYNSKERKSNLDLFSWGIAHYKAGEYTLTDTVFAQYAAMYPDNIYGYYWRAQANAAMDTSLSEGLAIPYYHQMIAIGEKDVATNKKMLIKAYGYLAGYEANANKNYQASVSWFEKLLAIDPSDADALRNKEILEKWIAEGK
jgi:tetratricopeptide (TPR) repeat protein